MSQLNSFDIVSEIDFQEVDNAVNMATKEILQRYDLKNTKSEIELNKKDKFITVHSKDDFHVKICVDILQTKLIKRGLSIKALKYNEIQPASNGTAKQKLDLQSGIDKEKAKNIVKMIKDTKLKVNATIQDEQVRVAGKDKDDLQAIIKMIKDADLPFATQFVNYK